MVDTLVLRIHALEVYSQLVTFLVDRALGKSRFGEEFAKYSGRF